MITYRPEASWYVVGTAGRQERRAVAALRELRVPAYMPAERRWVRHARAKVATDFPYFPGYVFAHLTADDIDAARRADGVTEIVGSCGRPRPISPMVVATLIALEALGVFDLTRPPPAKRVKLEKGDPVRIADGQFAGWVGEVVRARGRNRVMVLLKAFGDQTTRHRKPVDLPVELVEPA